MIKGLARQLNEAGKIKIGKKGDEIVSSKGTTFRPPVKLDHFIITTTEKDGNGDLVEDAALMGKVKEAGRGRVNGNNDITGIPIRLLYDDNDLNFPSRLACYVNGILSCEGDGEVARKRIDNFEKDHSCPCNKFEPGYSGNDKCKANGTLTCVIDEAELFGQAHKFRTTSINSVKGILGGIELIKTATKGKIAGLPLMLVVDNKSTTIPGSGQQTVVQVVSICYRGSMADLRGECIQLLENEKKFLLGMDQLEKEAKANGAGVIVEPDEEMEFQEEFYPDSASDSDSASDVIIDVEADEVVVKSDLADDTSGQVSVEKQKPEPASPSIAGPVIVNSRDLLSEEGKAIAEKKSEEVEKDLNKIGLFNRLQRETDPDKAIALAKRNDKKYLIEYLKKNIHPEDIPADGSKKPAYVDAAVDYIGSPRWKERVETFISLNQGINHGDVPVEPKKTDEEVPPKTPTEAQPADTPPKEEPADQKAEPETPEDPSAHPFISELQSLQKRIDIVEAIRLRFPDNILNGTVPPSELIGIAKRWLAEEVQSEAVESEEFGMKTEPIDPERYDADSGELVGKPQLNQMVALKDQGKIQNEQWGQIVSRFTKADGSKAKTAVELTVCQGETLIEIVKRIVAESEGVPF